MSVDSLKSQRKEKKNEFNTYAKRRDKIEKIISSIYNDLDNDVDDVNREIDKCINELNAGIEGVKVTTSVGSALSAEKENMPGSDNKLSSCVSALTNEKSRCQRRINELDREIKSLEQQIRDEGGTIYFWE